MAAGTSKVEEANSEVSYFSGTSASTNEYKPNVKTGSEKLPRREKKGAKIGPKEGKMACFHKLSEQP